MLDLNASHGARWVEMALIGTVVVILASLILA